MSRCTFGLILLAGAVLAGGCGEATGDREPGSDTPDPAKRIGSVLVVDGAAVDETGRRGVAPTASITPKRAVTPAPKRSMSRTRAGAADDAWPAPTLLADGTIDDGPDPFGSEPVQVQALPIEDDPAATGAIDGVASRLRRVERTQWDGWMAAGLRSPWSQAADPVLGGLVKVTVERCGGARTVATGVVLADATVVTTVHAIESPARRVRISPAFGGGARIPAMVRYMDVDEDVAVLKVPGLVAKPMPFHAVTGDSPQWGYAYGVSRGGLAGTIRRTPAVVAMRPATISREQPDGLAEQIRDRSTVPFVGAVDSGFSGGVVMASNDPEFVKGWGFQGLIRARVPFRADTAGVAVPAPLVDDALDAEDRLEPWFEHRAGRCPQWVR